MRPRMPLIFLLGICIGISMSLLFSSLRQSPADRDILYRLSVNSHRSADANVSDKSPSSQNALYSEDFSTAYNRQRLRQNQSMYYFERPGRLIPIMRLAEHETNPVYRVSVAKRWLRTQSIVIAATVQNALPGLVSGLKNMARLRKLFAKSWVLIVENNSDDDTRKRLLNETRSDLNFLVLGCGTINSAKPCRIDVRYGSGRPHGAGQTVKRTMEEEVDRGLIMSALRNEYLNFAYEFLADKANLMLMIDPDIEWQDWDIDKILQSLYYFKTKPQLQQLCANTIDIPSNRLFDPCTLAFFNNKRFGEDTVYPSVDYYKSIHRGAKDLPPVKVESCFQAFAFYRMNALYKSRLQYERSHGEWICEHNTLSRQLQEVYIDPQMRLGVLAANVG